MQRRSWNAIRLERLKDELRKAKNTPEEFWRMFEFHELQPLEAIELSEQVNWPPGGAPDPYLLGMTAKAEPPQPEPVKPAAPAMVVKSYAPPAPPPKMVIKRY